MIVSAVGRAHLRQALRDHVGRWGADRVPHEIHALLDFLDRVHGQSDAPDSTPVDATDRRVDHALVSYTEASDRLGVSRSTVGRLVAAGRLDRRGRRITRASVDRYLGEG